MRLRLYQCLEDAGVEVVLANPKNTKAIAEEKLKNDKVDACTSISEHFLSILAKERIYVVAILICNMSYINLSAYFHTKGLPRNKLISFIN